MARVRVERNIGHDAESGKPLLQRQHGPRHKTVFMPSFGGILRLLVGCDHGKKRDRRNAQRLTGFGVVQEQVDALARYARQ